MNLSEGQIRWVIIVIGFAVLVVIFGANLAIKYLIGGVIAGLIGIGVTMLWNKITEK